MSSAGADSLYSTSGSSGQTFASTTERLRDKESGAYGPSNCSSSTATSCHVSFFLGITRE